MRVATVDHLLTNHGKFQCVLRDGFVSLEDYVMTQKMYDGGSWATELEILAMVDMLQVDICTFDDVNNWYRFSANYFDNNRPSVGMATYLYHRGRVHYDVVLSVAEITLQLSDVIGKPKTSSKQSVQCDLDMGFQHNDSQETVVNKVTAKTVVNKVTAKTVVKKMTAKTVKPKGKKRVNLKLKQKLAKEKAREKY